MVENAVIIMNLSAVALAFSHPHRYSKVAPNVQTYSRKYGQKYWATVLNLPRVLRPVATGT